MPEIKSMQLKTNKKGDLTLYIKKYKDIDKIIIRDIDYLIDRVFSKSKENIFNSTGLNDLISDLYKQCLDILNTKENISSVKDIKNKMKLTGFVYVSKENVFTPIVITLTKLQVSGIIKLELKFKNVKSDLYICKENGSCETRKKSNLYPYDICCCGCELNKTCYLACNQRNSICFDKEKL